MPTRSAVADPVYEAADYAHAPVVSFHDVSLRYTAAAKTARTSASSGEDFVLKNLNFELPRGSFHFLTGPSGAGKTSLLRMIYMSLKPTMGSVEVLGESVRTSDRAQIAALRSRMGIVFQDFRLLDHLSVFDNVALPLFIRGRKVKSYREDVSELLNWVGLHARLDDMPDVLSGGEKQRLAIARAVVTQPTLILADEPTGNIDYALGLRIMRLFVELNRLGTTVLIATHDEGLIRAAGMPVLDLKDGHLSQRDLNAQWPPHTDPLRGRGA